MIDKLGKGMAKVLQILIATIIFGLLLLNSVQVVLRYTVKSGIIWANDLQIFCLYVIVSLAIPYLWLERKHVCMDYADKVFSKKVLSILAKTCDVWACIISSLMFISAKAAFRSNRGMITNTLKYDESLNYLPFIIGAILWFIAAVIDLVRRLKEGD